MGRSLSTVVAIREIFRPEGGVHVPCCRSRQNLLRAVRSIRLASSIPLAVSRFPPQELNNCTSFNGTVSKLLAMPSELPSISSLATGCVQVESIIWH